MKFKDTRIRFGFAALILLSQLPVAEAETTIAFQTNRIWISTDGIDDHFVCKLNEGTPDEKIVVEMKFGEPAIIWREFSGMLKPGVNKLRCVATDQPADGGRCFAFGYRIYTGKNEGGIDISSYLVHARGASCCSMTCARTNPVHDETIWITK